MKSLLPPLMDFAKMPNTFGAHQLNLVVGDGYSGRCRSRDSTEKPTPIRQPKSRGNKSSRNTNAVTYLLNYLFVLISDRFKLVLRGRVELIPF